MSVQAFSGLAAMDLAILVGTGGSGIRFPIRRAALIDAIFSEVMGRMPLMF